MIISSNNLPVSPNVAGEAQAVSEHSGQGRNVADFNAPAGSASPVNRGAGTTLDPLSSEEHRVAEANRRLELLKTFDGMLAAGYTKKSACKELQTGYATIWRWRKNFEKKGFNGLLPETEKCGRKSTLQKLNIPQSVIDEIRGLNLDTESTTSALRVFAQSDRCPEELARVILDPNRSSKHALPPSIRRAVTVNENLRLAHRGPRQLSLRGIWTPRKMDILPGDIFSSDDTTPIFAWWVPWVECEEYPFGVKLLQGQFLPLIDVASQNPLTFALIAREKSSYRASDIWALFGHTFETVGIPRLGFQLERGSWEAHMIAGQEVEYRDGETTQSRRVGGLRQLPTSITKWHEEKLGNFQFPQTLQTWTSYLPKSKSIEAFLDRSQTLEGTLWGSLGRDQMRRPYEKMKRLFQECSRPGAKTDPRQNFLSQAELTTRLLEMHRYLGNEPMEGEVFNGIPRQKFDAAVAEHPLLKLPEEDRWLYRRSWKRETITQGWVRIRLTHEISGTRYSLFYINESVFSQHESEDVFVYYDLEDFESPAQIILARTGKYLCEARYEDRKGSFLGGDCTGHDIRKKWKNAVMTAYATIAKHAPSRQLPPEIKARREAAKIQQSEQPAPTSPSVIVPSQPRPMFRRTAPIVPEVSPDDMQRQRERLERQARRARAIVEAEEFTG